MKKKNYFLCIGVMMLLITACNDLQKLASDTYNSVSKELNKPSSTEIASGLKEALQIGTQQAVKQLNKVGAYRNNPAIKIAFPPQAAKVADKLRSLGMTKLVNDFEKSMNTAAEKAAIYAKPIFVDAIKQMTINDAVNILNGNNRAATDYFQRKTNQRLHAAFKPHIQQSLNQVNATKYWNNITTTYNKLPMVKPVNTDLAAYVTQKAIDGLYVKIAEEEKKIRTQPAARVTDLLRKVFGS